MPGGTRSKLREELEGIHKNTEWIKAHCVKGLALLPPTYKQLITGFATITELNVELDKLAKSLYDAI